MHKYQVTTTITLAEGQPRWPEAQVRMGVANAIRANKPIGFGDVDVRQVLPIESEEDRRETVLCLSCNQALARHLLGQFRCRVEAGHGDGGTCVSKAVVFARADLKEIVNTLNRMGVAHAEAK